ncbi:site-specific DNA-methyltransferase [Candidatus Binatia bacterium]|nr:site-specific DNA-methyltransferase [Candidatus Binatia bacterium]
MATKKNSRTSIPVDSFRHKDKRKNIPTEELRDFVAEEEENYSTMLYPRDPSLDPQLVWTGKDKQDRADLAVPVVPIYIQEKIHPQALVENLRDTAGGGAGEPEHQLFLDFNGLDAHDFEQKVDFYRHDQNWSNRMILGDSLLVMTSLAEKEGLKGKVQMIYVDPPYGIKFGSNWQVSTRKRDVKDGKAEDATREPEQVRAFRDTWQLGIHSYLAYLRDRLVVARELLTETGSIFVQIGDENVHLVRSVLDEVFGSENQVVTILVKKKGGQRSGYIDPVNDYLLWYSKTPRNTQGGGPKFHAVFAPRALDDETTDEFSRVELPNGGQYPLRAVQIRKGETIDYRRQISQLFIDHPGAQLFRPWPITNGGTRANQMDPITLDGKVYRPPTGRCWSHTSRTDDASFPGMERVKLADRLIASGTSLDFKRYLSDFPFKLVSNWWDGLGGAADPIYVVQTNPEIVKRCILMTTDPGDLVLDQTCGSGTTAFVAEQWGRRWITIDTSRVALAIARTRLMAAQYPYYLLADSPEGVQKEMEITGKIPPPHKTEGDIRKGFVYKRALRVTSGVIANNPDIKQGMSRKDIDRAIARHADQETLYDQPFEDGKRIRVTGPFTVESLSPHRVLSADSSADCADYADSDSRDSDLRKSAQSADISSPDFATMILDNLRKAGVQNTKKKERLTFDTLEPHPGTWVHAAGTFAGDDGKKKRVAVSIGPEHGTVGPQQVKEAAKEAVQGVGFDLLIVCGFAFDPHVAEEAKRYGKLTVLPARMNPDLAMGDELLKKTGAGNLFMVFGEPDLQVKKAKDGKLVAQLKGVDIYDPTTGEIRSSSTDDIACWFIDTNYNGESFFVRHAYFTGADEPYEKLKRALRAEINEEAWTALHSTESLPFAKPETGKIAVKVINHYGDEVLKVFEV